MAVLAPIAAAGAAFASSTIGSLLISVGLQAASQLLSKKGKKENQQTQSRGRQLNLAVQTDVPNVAVLGKTAVGGSLVYRDTFGSSNRDLYMVICLADHECDGLETIFVDGKAVGWDEQSGAVSDYSGHLFIEFFNGAPGQVPSQTMINHGKGKWTTDHIGTGRAYVVVRMIYSDSVWPNGVPDFRFVLRGLKFYDWRLDSTRGGSGAHRQDDPSTWEWSENPVVALVNYMMGVHVEGVKRWGRNVPLDAIDFDSATLAANSCDELIPLEAGGNEKRYTIGGVLNATVDHKTHEVQILECCMGLMVNTGGYTRIRAGVPQVPLMHFDDGEIVVGTEMIWLPKLSGDQLVNTIRGKFTDPALVYEPGVTLTRFASEDVLNDGGELAIEQDFEFVTSGTQCQRLMEILRREARLQGQLDVVYGAKAYLLEVGDWVTISSNRQGWENKVFEVAQTQGLNDQVGVRITFKETDVSIYDWSTDLELSAGESGELPTYELPTFSISGLTVDNFTVETPGGEVRPGLNVAWNAPDDTRVKSIVIEYRILGETNSLTTESFDPDSGAHQFVNGVLGNVTYEVRARPVTSLNANEINWTAWVSPNNNESTGDVVISKAVTVETLTNPITADDISPEVLEDLRTESAFIDAQAEINRLQLEQSERSAEASLHNMLNIAEEAEATNELERKLYASLSNTAAQINEQLIVLASETEAVAQHVTEVETSVDENTSTITTQAQSINGFSSAYIITVTQNGEVTGLAQLSGEGQESAFRVLADKFQVAMPGGQGSIPAFVAQLDNEGNPELLVNGKLKAEDIKVGTLKGFTLEGSTIIAPHIYDPNGFFEIDARGEEDVFWRVG